jgi:hypothetical protein
MDPRKPPAGMGVRVFLGPYVVRRTSTAATLAPAKRRWPSMPELTDSDLRDRPRLRLDAPEAELELPEDRGELRRAGRPKAVVELRRAA